MRASPGPEPRPFLILAILLVVASSLAAPAQDAAPQPAARPLEPAPRSVEPAFRLPAGGKALAGPVVDVVQRPPAAWLLSEDGALYALTESGALAARVPLPGSPARFLATDAFGRALVLLDQGRLAAYTRLGSRAWDFELGEGAGAPAGIASGSDGRLFVATPSRLLCLNPGGRLLWAAALPGRTSCPPSVDGLGRPCAGLADGRVACFDAYGTTVGTARLGSAVLCLAPILGSPAAAAGTVPAAAGTVLAAACADGRLRLIARDLSLIAEAALSPLPLVGLATGGGIVYALDSGGAAIAIDAAGVILWKTQTACRDGTLSLFAERLLVSSSGRGVSLSLGGEVIREISIANASGRAAPSPSGLLFSAGADWVLAAYRFEKALGAPLVAATPAYPIPEDLAAGYLLYDPRAGEGDRQISILSDIEKSLESSSIGAEEGRAAGFCQAVALGEFDGDRSETERRRRANPLARAMACAILGELGSPAYRAALIRVLATDSDSAVRAQACEALGAIGVDPDGLTAAAFLAAASRPVEEGTAMSLIAAVERMALRSGTPPTIDSIRAVIQLANLPYGAFVRDRAMAALGRLAGAVGP